MINIVYQCCKVFDNPSTKSLFRTLSRLQNTHTHNAYLSNNEMTIKVKNRTRALNLEKLQVMQLKKRLKKEMIRVKPGTNEKLKKFFLLCLS